jgi:hypothetical protein
MKKFYCHGSIEVMEDTYTGEIKKWIDRTKNMLPGINTETFTTTSEAEEVESNYCNYLSKRR